MKTRICTLLSVLLLLTAIAEVSLPHSRWTTQTAAAETPASATQTETAAFPTETPAFPTETPAFPTETPAFLTETPASLTETAAFLTETAAFPTETAAPLSGNPLDIVPALNDFVEAARDFWLDWFHGALERIRLHDFSLTAVTDYLDAALRSHEVWSEARSDELTSLLSQLNDRAVSAAEEIASLSEETVRLLLPDL